MLFSSHESVSPTPPPPHSIPPKMHHTEGIIYPHFHICASQLAHNGAGNGSESIRARSSVPIQASVLGGIFVAILEIRLWSASNIIMHLVISSSEIQ